MSRMIIALLASAASVVAAAHLGLTGALGAHPFWATKVAWIGAPVGMVLAMVLWRLPKLPVLAGLVLLTVAAYVLAHNGKTAFAASFAEDQRAGQFWYFGWIAAAAGLTATISTALRQGRVREP